MSELEPRYFDIQAIPIPALMYQTGYLTIKSFARGKYTLGFPNIEVQSALQRHMMGLLLNKNLSEIANFSSDVADALISEDVEKRSQSHC